MRLTFDGRLYSVKAVETAAGAFEDWARFRVEERKGLIEVEAEARSDELDGAFSDEFANYVLGAMRE
ncbi:HxsD-like protein [Elusimicrobiota bacterium]